MADPPNCAIINTVNKYNYVVINDIVEDAAKKVNAILLAERSRVDRIEETFLNSLEEEVQQEPHPFEETAISQTPVEEAQEIPVEQINSYIYSRQIFR